MLTNRFNARFVLIENTARGPDLIDEILGTVSAKVIAVNPRGSKADRFKQCVPIIRAKRIKIRRREPVEAAVDEILAYPNSSFDDHVDAMTNMLIEMPKWLKTASRASNEPPSRPQARPVLDGFAIAYGRSIFGPTRLPDFSNGNGEPRERGGRSPYEADTETEPMITFDGTKTKILK